jgi:type I restriction enzyme, S subunit
MSLNKNHANSWKWEKLESVLLEKPCNGLYKPENYLGTGIAFLDINGLYKGLYADFSQARKIQVTEDEYQQYQLRDNDILFNRVSKKAEGVGKAVVVDSLQEPAVYESNMIRIRVKQQKVDSKFLIYYFSSEKSRKELLSKANISNQASINQNAIKTLKIPLPPIEEQKRIAAILDKADAIRRSRKKAIALIEELLRSLFLDMFGDPVTNPKGWRTGTILDVVGDPKTGVRCGPFGTQLKVHEIVSEGIPLYGIENVKGGKFISATSKYLTKSKARDLSAFDVKTDDVLVTRMGTIGHACVIPRGIEDARISCHLFRIRSNPDKCLPGFLAATITRSGTFMHQLQKLSHGAIMSGLKTGDLKEVRFLIPPIELQQEYLRLVKQTEQSIYNQNQALEEENNLFNSLLQKAFRGEL